MTGEVPNITEDLETKVDRLAGRVETLSKAWCADISDLVNEGEVGAAVALAALIQLARGVLEHLPPESRAYTIRAIATPGIDVDAACQRVTS